jgi:hypothetical protein
LLLETSDSTGTGTGNVTANKIIRLLLSYTSNLTTNGIDACINY